MPSLTLSAGIVITPVFGFICKPCGASFGNVQVPSSPFVAITVLSFPSLSLYVTVIDFVSSSPGGVISMAPSSFDATVGAPGAVVSLAFTLAASEVFSPAFATALTSASFFNLFAGKVISPVFSSTVMSLSVFPGNFHLPSLSFSAFNVFSPPVGSLYVTSISFAFSSAGLTVTLPSLAALIVGALSFSSTVSF